VALARALAPKPRLLLLDEPFSGLDIRLRDKMRDVTLRVLKEAGIATLIVTHDPEEAMYMADRIVLMREGRVVQSGAPAEVYRAPVSTFATTFLSDVNWTHGTVADGAVASAFGRLDAGGMTDGMRVDVLIRPEAISVADGESNVLADVVAVHPLGHSSIVVLRLAESGAQLRARLPGSRVPEVGARISVALDRDQTFVFPCAPPNTKDQ
jgi:iron(III) transport system ATP-binding protein